MHACKKLLPQRTVQALLGWISKPTAQKRHAEAFRRWIAFLQHKRELVIAAPRISIHRGFFRNFICLSHFFRDFVQRKRGDQISYQIILHITLSMPWCFEPFFQILGFGYKARGLLGMSHQKFVFQKYLKDIGLNSRFKMVKNFINYCVWLVTLFVKVKWSWYDDAMPLAI